jgi:hypothetical protein
VNGFVLSPTTLTVVHPDAEKRKVTRDGLGNEAPVTAMMSAPLVERALDGDVAKVRRGMKGRIAVDDVGLERSRMSILGLAAHNYFFPSTSLSIQKKRKPKE